MVPNRPVQCHSQRPQQVLGKASLRHVRALFKQLLLDSDHKLSQQWVDTLLPMVLQCVDQVDPNLQRGDNMDIRIYIKLKRVPGGRIDDSRLISGIIFTKNVAVKGMRLKITRPKIAIITFPLEYAHTQEGVISLDTIFKEEREHLRRWSARIASRAVNVLFAAEGVSSLAMQFLNEAGVVVVQHVKSSVLHAISRCTGAHIVSSVDELLQTDFAVGSSGRFDVKTYVTKPDGSTRKTVVILSGCSPDLGATLLLRGADKAELGRIKRLTEFICYVVYNLHLERSLLLDEGIVGVEDVQAACGVRPNVLFENSPEDDLLLRHDSSPGPAQAAPSQEEFYTDIVRRLRSRILSSSPRVVVTEPYALSKARAEERRLARVRAERDRYDQLRTIKTPPGSANKDNPEPRKEPDDAFALVVPSMIHQAVEKTPSTLRDFMYMLYADEYEQALLAHEYQKQQWLAYKHDDLFDPIQHQQLAVLASCVNESSGFPCQNPEVSRFIYYNDDDLFDEHSNRGALPGDNERLRHDVTLGQYVRNLVLSAHRQCHCTANGYKHRWQFVHGNGQVSIRLQRLNSLEGSALEGWVTMWSSCRICKTKSQRKQMSEGTWKFSFAKYLELTFWGVPMRLSEDSVDPECKISGGEDGAERTLCSHDAHKDFIRYIALSNTVVSIQYDPIEMWQLALPSGVIRWSVDADLILKNAQFEKADQMILSFASSVRKRLNAMEQAVKVMEKDKSEKKSTEKKDEKASATKSGAESDSKAEQAKVDESSPRPSAELGAEKDKDTDSTAEKKPVPPMDAEESNSLSADLPPSLPSPSKPSDVSASIKEKTEEVEEEPSTMQQCQAELTVLRARIDTEFVQLRTLLRGIYTGSKHYEVLPFDKAIVKLHRRSLEWQEDFARIEQAYFPSEVMIDQLASTIMNAEDDEMVEPTSDRTETDADKDGPEGFDESKEKTDPESEILGSDEQTAETTGSPSSEAQTPKPATPIPPLNTPTEASRPAELSKDIKSKIPVLEDSKTGSNVNQVARARRAFEFSGATHGSQVHKLVSQIEHALKREVRQGSRIPIGSISRKSRLVLEEARRTRLVHDGLRRGKYSLDDSIKPRGAIDDPKSTRQRIKGDLKSIVSKFDRKKISPKEARAGAVTPADEGVGGRSKRHSSSLIPEPVGSSAQADKDESKPGSPSRRSPRGIPRARKSTESTKSERSTKADQADVAVVEPPRTAVEDRTKVNSSASSKPECVTAEPLVGAAKESSLPKIVDEPTEAGAEQESPIDKTTPEPLATKKPEGDAASIPKDQGAAKSDNEQGNQGTPDKAPPTEDPPPKTGKSDGSTPEGESFDLDHALSRNTLVKILLSLWPKKPAPGWPALEVPLTPLEHVLPNHGDFILREDEPTSVIALALAMPEYYSNLEDARSIGDPWSVQDCPQQDSKTKFTFNISDPQKQVKASCRVLYAAQFDSLRRKAGVADRFVDSLARCKKWDSKGGKTRSLFLKTLDDRFVVKSLSPIEAQSFNQFANDYFLFMQNNLCHGLASALAKIMGLFHVTIKSSGGTEFSADMLVMENIFYERSTDRRYDLKGSMRNRRIESTGEEDEVLLDENLVEQIYKQPVFAREHDTRVFTTSIGNDSLFLSRQNVVDYSLIAGFDDGKKEVIVGIIDYIRTYTWDKRIENWIKDRSFKNQPTIVRPEMYRNRFRKAMSAYILQAPAYWYHFYVNDAVLKESLEDIGTESDDPPQR